MKTVAVWSYIFFGTSLRYLQEVVAGQRVHGDGHVSYNIDEFLGLLDNFGLTVTRRASYNLKDMREKLSKIPEDGKLDADMASEIVDIANTLRPTLVAESQGMMAYIATDKRYEIEKLTRSIWQLFHSGLQSRLTDTTIHDIEEAGKCIAFERSTAAAFHLMRAVEGTLKQYYCAKVKRNRCPLMWGAMVAALRKVRKPPSALLLDHLDSLRRNFRNPTQHPDKVYDIQEAQDLFGVCIDALNRLDDELMRLK